ncbi:MAG: hypothetical protein IKL07_09170 [Clostridium sp.]|nr:hypothetical protein [Clostridium sp.]
MEKVLSLLNDIETKANKILSRVSDDKTRLSEEMNQKMRSFDSKVQIETTEKLDALRRKANQDVDAELAKLKKEQADYLFELDQTFDVKCEQYVHDIFERIIT